MQEQRELEAELQRTSIYEYASRIRKLRDKGQEAHTDPILHTLSRYIGPVADGILEHIEAAKHKPGAASTAVRLIEEADPTIVALLALRSVLDSVSRPRRIQTVAVRIGREVEGELRFESYKKTHPGLFHTVNKNIRESPHAHRRDYHRAVLTYTANKFDVPWTDWTEAQKAHVGTFLIHVLLKHTPLVEIRKYKAARGRGMRVDLVGTADLLNWLDDQHSRLAAMRPKRLPMLCEPLPWEGLTGGGYLTPEMQHGLVRLRRPEYAHLYNPDEMPVVFEALNYLQTVPYRINQKVYDVASSMWMSGQPLPKAANRVEVELPEKPNENAPRKELKEYKERARKIHFQNQRNKGRRLVASQTLSISKRFLGRTFYFPYHLDFRGRTYASSQYLSPQGADLSKGLIRFAEAKPLGKRGAWWLAVYIANCWGEDKVNLDERAEWAYESSDWLVDIARDPHGNKDWHDADKPFQFLAACFEWLGYTEEGEAYPSSIAIELDGSCNGIQHLAALSLDEEAGELVNLLPNGKPADIYQKVADRTTEAARICEDARLGRCEAPEHLKKIVDQMVKEPVLGAVADLWLNAGLSRGICKRPTMILPYNGTLKAVRGYIADYLTDEIEEGGPDVFGDSQVIAANWLGSVMWQTMSEVVTGPRKTMDWVAKVAAEANKTGQPLVWRSPSNFLVVQAYPMMVSSPVKTKVGDTVYKHLLTYPSNDLDSRRQARSTAPNLVHGLDAAALHGTAVNLSRLGVRAFRVVHDGYGTHAADTDLMLDQTKAVFIGQYNQGDLRLKFMDDVAMHAGIDTTEIEAPPPLGSLDIERVADADYFFA